jgi:hypothetical protein
MEDSTQVRDPGIAAMPRTDSTFNQQGVGRNSGFAEEAVGLGISTTSTTLAELSEDGESKPKKKKKKPKKSEKESNGGDGEPSDPAIPTTNTTSKPPVFVFGQNSDPQTNADDNISEASSHTLGRVTPTSDEPSPTQLMTTRKLPPRSTGHGHLLEAKQPSWQQKKRVFSGRSYDTASDETDEDEVEVVNPNIVWMEKTSAGDESSDGDSKEPTKVHLYVGPSLQAEAEGANMEPSVEEQQDEGRRVAEMIYGDGA